MDLLPFCATGRDAEIRSFLAVPWSLGDYTYATNGHILVRVARDASAPPNADNKFATSFRKAFLPGFERQLAERTFAPLPGWRVIPADPGRPCDPCEGDDCEICGGDGVIGQRDEIAAFPTQQFSLGYIGMIAPLPQLTVAFGGGASSHIDSALMFRFEHGVGALMPIIPTAAEASNV